MSAIAIRVKNITMAYQIDTNIALYFLGGDKQIAGVLDDCVVLDLNGQIKGKTVQLHRKYGLKLPDCIDCCDSMLFGRASL